MNDPDLREPPPARMPAQLWQPWTLIVPAILLLPLLSLAFAWQISPSSDADLRRPIFHYPRGEETLAPTPAPQPETEPTPLATLPPIAALPKLTYFVPGSDGQLNTRTFPLAGGHGQTEFVALGSAALRALFPDAPGYFPPGTQLQSLKLDESTTPLALVSLNENFWNSDFWSGESRTDAALQAIAHTLEAAYKQTSGKGPLQIQILRDEHEMDVLGEYDMREPYTPDPAVVAKIPTKKSRLAPVTKP